MKSLTFIEIDVDHCGLEYGVAPCMAQLGETGPIKCFNSLGTCQDRANFTNDPRTIRFCKSSAHYAEADIDAIPMIDSLAITPATISLGENLGQRASVSVTFHDAPWPDIGEFYDKYRAERDYQPREQGSYWGKFRARHPFLRNRKMRVIQGVVGQSLAEMETRHYLIDSYSGPSVNGKYTITAKDPIKALDGDRAQAPKVSNGFLITGIDDEETTILLNPNGIGDLEYPASGLAAIGGKEIVSFTRTADVLTVVRGEMGSEPQEHDAGDRVQLCLEYTAEDAADIISDLMTTYAGIDSALMDVASWKDETTNFLRRVYSAVIAEPTPVKRLVEELVEQAALAIWWDDLGQRIRLQVLRQISTDAVTYGESDCLEGSLSSQDQPNRRISQVWTYYGQINPLRSVDDADNYRSIATTIDLQSETDEGSPAIKKIFSRWTPTGGRQLALRVNDIQLGRYRVAPRRISLDLFRYPQLARRPIIGEGYRVASWHFQGPDGARVTVPAQVTRLGAEADRYRIEMEEMRFASFDPEDLDNRIVILDSSLPNAVLREIHDLLYPPAEAGDEVTCIIDSGAIMWSQTAGTPAFRVGNWPAGVIVNVILRGRIQGRAGNGGAGASQSGLSTPGGPGGVALYTRHPVNLTLDQGAGQVWGGGGGGGGGGWGRTQNFFGQISNRTGGGGGGGGAGFLAGSGGAGGQAMDGFGFPGQPGTQTQGGAGGSTTDPNRAGHGGNGGNQGQPGQPGGNGNQSPGGAGGAAGAAIDGVSFVTKTGTGSILGAETN